MIRRAFTGAELDALAGAYYRACHQDDASDSWESLPDWRRWRHRRGVRALLASLDLFEDDHNTRELIRRPARSVRLNRTA